MTLFQIGVIGLVEKEWLVTLATIEPEDVRFTDYVECAKQLLSTLQVYTYIYITYKLLYVHNNYLCVHVHVIM